MTRWITVAATLALTLGCAGGVARWERPDTSPAQLESDQNDCMNKATIGGDPGSIDPNVRARAQKDYENCMLRKGYKLTVPDKRG